MSDEKKVEVAELTAEEVQAELNGRVEQFNKELLPLLGKYELGLGASAFVTPQGTIGARPIMFDARGQEAAAPAAAEEEAAPSGELASA